jgi:hypothetical protein
MRQLPAARRLVESRLACAGKHAKADKSPREHAILSDDARLLLGTIYLPKGRLIIDAVSQY